MVEERVSPARLGAAGGAARPVCGMGFVPLVWCVRYSTSYSLSSVEFNLKDNGQKARYDPDGAGCEEKEGTG